MTRPPSEPFTKTLQTAGDAESIATLLDRATERAKKGFAWGDAERLQSLAQRYRDYAQALRETVASEPEEPAADQAVLL